MGTFQAGVIPVVADQAGVLDAEVDAVWLGVVAGFQAGVRAEEEAAFQAGVRELPLLAA